MVLEIAVGSEKQMDNKLNPCPFCGSPGKVETKKFFGLTPSGREGEIQAQPYEFHYTVCSNEFCSCALTKLWPTAQDAEIFWNRRVKTQFQENQELRLVYGINEVPMNFKNGT